MRTSSAIVSAINLEGPANTKFCILYLRDSTAAGCSPNRQLGQPWAHTSPLNITPQRAKSLYIGPTGDVSFPRRFDINSTAAFSLQRCYTDLITHLCLWDLRWYPQHEFPHAVAQSIRRFPRHIGFTPDKLWMPCIKQDTSPTSELTD